MHKRASRFSPCQNWARDTRRCSPDSTRQTLSEYVPTSHVWGCCDPPCLDVLPLGTRWGRVARSPPLAAHSSRWMALRASKSMLTHSICRLLSDSVQDLRGSRHWRHSKVAPPPVNLAPVPGSLFWGVAAHFLMARCQCCCQAGYSSDSGMHGTVRLHVSACI